MRVGVSVPVSVPVIVIVRGKVKRLALTGSRACWTIEECKRRRMIFFTFTFWIFFS